MRGISMKKIMLAVFVATLLSACAEHSSRTSSRTETQNPELYGSVRMGVTHGSGYSDNRVGVKNY